MTVQPWPEFRAGNNRSLDELGFTDDMFDQLRIGVDRIIAAHRDAGWPRATIGAVCMSAVIDMLNSSPEFVRWKLRVIIDQMRTGTFDGTPIEVKVALSFMIRIVGEDVDAGDLPEFGDGPS